MWIEVNLYEDFLHQSLGQESTYITEYFTLRDTLQLCKIQG